MVQNKIPPSFLSSLFLMKSLIVLFLFHKNHVQFWFHYSSSLILETGRLSYPIHEKDIKK
jgi:hypothetical protein